MNKNINNNNNNNVKEYYDQNNNILTVTEALKQNTIKLDKELIEHEKEFQKALERAVAIGKGAKYLQAFDKTLLESGEIHNITHSGSSSVWLEASSSVPPPGKINVYRPMGDLELNYLIANGHLPDTQPYQAIIEGPNGRNYANKYLTGKKWTNTHPNAIVEFTSPLELIEKLRSIYTKVEDGALSIGLGNKSGNSLHFFNDSMKSGETTFRIVKLKRTIPT
eukprot:gene9176-11248_t